MILQIEPKNTHPKGKMYKRKNPFFFLSLFIEFHYFSIENKTYNMNDDDNRNISYTEMCS